MNPTSNIAAHMGTLEEYASKCTALIELGSEFGTGSTAAFSRGVARNPNCKIWVTIDLKDQIKPECRPTFPNWHFLQGDSRDPKLPQDCLQALRKVMPIGYFDLIFIDTDHNYEQLKAEIENWHLVMSLRSTWLFHDTWMNGSYNHMTDAAKEFAADNNALWKYVNLSKENNGLGALIPLHNSRRMAMKDVIPNPPVYREYSVVTVWDVVDGKSNTTVRWKGQINGERQQLTAKDWLKTVTKIIRGQSREGGGGGRW